MTVVMKRDLFGEEYAVNLRKCIHCGEEKSETDFAERCKRNNHIEYRNECKQCLGEKTRITTRLKRENPPPLDPNYQCPICLKTSDDLWNRGSYANTKISKKTIFVLDHDHITGKFRGYICDRCNTSLGAIEDNLENIGRMVTYLKEHGDVSKHKDIW